MGCGPYGLKVCSYLALNNYNYCTQPKFKAQSQNEGFTIYGKTQRDTTNLLEKEKLEVYRSRKIKYFPNCITY